MSHISRLLQRGIPVICQRPVLPETPKKLHMSESEVKEMIPRFIMREIANEKRDETIRKAKEEAAKKLAEDGQKLVRKPAPVIAKPSANTEAPTKPDLSSLHNIKLSDKIHASLVQILSSGKLRDPLLIASDLHICNVSLNHCRRKAIVQWSLLGVADPARIKAIDEAFDKHRKQVAHLIGQQVSTRFLPSYLFEYKEDPFGP